VALQRRAAAFERALPDRALAPRAPPQKPVAKKGSEYVNSAVKSKAKTDEQMEAAEAKAAVNDLDHFEQRLGR